MTFRGFSSWFVVEQSVRVRGSSRVTCIVRYVVNDVEIRTRLESRYNQLLVIIYDDLS